MLVLLADTHSTESTQFSTHLRETIADAELVVHAGDFTTAATLDAVESSVPELVAVAGNSDTPAVSERLPDRQVFEASGHRFLLVHGHRHDRTALSLLARQEEADIVVVGHTHRAGVDHIGESVVVNPGSHADPRGGQPTYGACRQVEDGVEVQIRTGGGQLRETVMVPAEDP